MKLRGVLCVSAVTLMSAFCTQASAVSCYLDNNPNVQYTSPITLTTADNLGSRQIGCGHRVGGTGCTVQLGVDLNLSGVCITLGKGVTFDGQGNDLHCTGSSYCLDEAIYTDNVTPAGTGATTISNVSLSGCWLYGLRHQNTNTGIAEDVTIDFPTNCTVVTVLGQPFSGAQYGIAQFDTVTRANISNAQGYGVGVYNGKNNLTVNDSVIRDSHVGIEVSSSTGTKLINVLLDGNDTSVNAGSGSYDAESQGSVFQNATSGHCPSSGLYCLDFTGSRASFVDFAIK